MYEAQDGQALPLEKDKVALYYDPPRAALKLTTVQSAARVTMAFQGTANAANAMFILASAATERFVSTSWLQRAGVAHTPSAGVQVSLADNHKIQTYGQVTLKIRLGAWQEKLQCHVIDMPGFDIILGDG